MDSQHCIKLGILVSVFIALKRQGQEDWKLQASMGYMSQKQTKKEILCDYSLDDSISTAFHGIGY